MAAVGRCAQALDDLHTLTADVAWRLPRSADARIERGKLSLSARERVEEPPAVDAARTALTGLIAPIDQPDLLMEDDINRLAASFKDGLVAPSLVIAKLQAMQRQNLWDVVAFRQDRSDRPTRAGLRT